MLPALLKNLTPNILWEAIKTNPELFLHTLQNFESFKLFGAALTQERQIFISNNLHRVNDFLISEDGKVHIAFLIDAFEEFVNKKAE